MKKLVCLLAMLLLCSIVHAIEQTNSIPMPILQTSKADYQPPYYFNFYKIDEKNFKMSFIPLSKQQLKLLSIEEKKIYKKTKKIEKKLQRNIFDDKNIDIGYLPLYTNMYNFFEKRNDKKSQIACLEYIKLYDKWNFFSKNWIDYNLGCLYYDIKDFKTCIRFIKPEVDKSKTLFSYNNCILSDSYLQIKDYKNAIKYASTVPEKDYWYNFSLETLYCAYYNTKNMAMAHKIALKTVQRKYPSEYLANMRAAITASDNNTKMKYYNNAKKATTDDKEIWTINSEIAKIDANKIENAARYINGFFVKPNWAEISKKDTSLMSISIENQRFEEWHSDVNNCISKYKGNDLKACFNNINNKQDKISTKLLAEQQAREQKLLELQRIQQLQQMNYNMIRANQLQAQQNYILNSPRYTNTTTTRYGNTYYTNSYSY